VHVLIETHGALRDAFDIAALPQVECLSFGIMDFVSAHYGAIPASAMRTPGQFTHPLVVRAKLEMAAACHAHGKVASHNVTTEIKDSAVVANDAAARRRRIRLHAHVEHPPGPDQADRQGLHAAPVRSERATHPDRRRKPSSGAPIRPHGRLHDRASYRYYWTVLQRAKLAGLALPEAAALRHLVNVVQRTESTLMAFP
jgi:citrate lyase subunit beta/citryl-CoA lyase